MSNRGLFVITDTFRNFTQQTSPFGTRDGGVLYAGRDALKLYGNDRESETRYSDAECIGCCAIPISGNPKAAHISTSFVERQNWSVRTAMRRYTRLSNGSRKIENHAAAVALNYFAYNFIKIHRTLRVSPAMAAGVTDNLWSVSDLVDLWESEEAKRAA